MECQFPLCELGNEDGNAFRETELSEYVISICGKRLSHDQIVKQYSLFLKVQRDGSLSPTEYGEYFVLESLPDEAWKEIQKFNGRLCVSSYGRIKSRVFVSGKWLDKQILSTQIHNGYRNVVIYANPKPIPVWVHVEVITAFIPKTEEDIRLGRTYCNHKDGNKLNNTVSNLEWCTNQENCIHAFSTGLAHARVGEDANRAKLTNIDVARLKDKFYNNTSAYDVAKEFGISETEVLAIVEGRRFRDQFDEKEHKRRMADRVVPNKQVGLGHPRCKATLEKIQELQDLVDSGKTLTELQNYFGVDRHTLSAWLHNTWGANLPKAKQEGMTHSQSKATPDILRSVGRMLALGMTAKDIARTVGVVESTIREWKNSNWSRKYIEEGFSSCTQITERSSNE